MCSARELRDSIFEHIVRYQPTIIYLLVSEYRVLVDAWEANRHSCGYVEPPLQILGVKIEVISLI